VDDVADVMPSEAGTAVVGVTAPALRAVVADQWEATMARYPTWATSLGDHRYDAELTDASQEAHDAWNRQMLPRLPAGSELEP
jgi:hypothetical protein